MKTLSSNLQQIRVMKPVALVLAILMCSFQAPVTVFADGELGTAVTDERKEIAANADGTSELPQEESPVSVKTMGFMGESLVPEDSTLTVEKAEDTSLVTSDGGEEIGKIGFDDPMPIKIQPIEVIEEVYWGWNPLAWMSEEELEKLAEDAAETADGLVSQLDEAARNSDGIKNALADADKKAGELSVSINEAGDFVNDLNNQAADKLEELDHVNSDYQAQHDALALKRDQLAAEKAGLEEAIKNLEAESAQKRSAADTEIADLKKQLEAKEAEEAALAAELKDLEDKIASLQDAIAALQEKLAAAKKPLGQLIRIRDGVRKNYDGIAAALGKLEIKLAESEKREADLVAKQASFNTQLEAAVADESRLAKEMKAAYDYYRKTLRKDDYAAYKKLQTAHGNASAAIKKIKNSGEFRNLSNQIKKEDALQTTTTNEIAGKKKSLAPWEVRLKEAEGNLNSAQKEYDALSAELEALVKGVEDAEDRKQALLSGIEALDGDQSGLNGQIELISGQADAAILAITNSIGEKKDLIQHTDQAMEGLLIDIAALDKNHQEDVAKIESSREDLKIRLAAAQEKLAALQAAFNENGAHAESLKKEISELASVIAGLTRSLEQNQARQDEIADWLVRKQEEAFHRFNLNDQESYILNNLPEGISFLDSYPDGNGGLVLKFSAEGPGTLGIEIQSDYYCPPMMCCLMAFMPPRYEEVSVSEAGEFEFVLNNSFANNIVSAEWIPARDPADGIALSDGSIIKLTEDGGAEVSRDGEVIARYVNVTTQDTFIPYCPPYAACAYPYELERPFDGVTQLIGTAYLREGRNQIIRKFYGELETSGPVDSEKGFLRKSIYHATNLAIEAGVLNPTVFEARELTNEELAIVQAQLAQMDLVAPFVPFHYVSIGGDDGSLHTYVGGYFEDEFKRSAAIEVSFDIDIAPPLGKVKIALDDNGGTLVWDRESGTATLYHLDGGSTEYSDVIFFSDWSKALFKPAPGSERIGHGTLDGQPGQFYGRPQLSEPPVKKIALDHGKTLVLNRDNTGTLYFSDGEAFEITDIQFFSAGDDSIYKRGSLDLLGIVGDSVEKGAAQGYFYGLSVPNVVDGAEHYMTDGGGMLVFHPDSLTAELERNLGQKIEGFVNVRKVTQEICNDAGVCDHNLFPKNDGNGGEWIFTYTSSSQDGNRTRTAWYGYRSPDIIKPPVSEAPNVRSIDQALFDALAALGIKHQPEVSRGANGERVFAFQAPAGDMNVVLDVNPYMDCWEASPRCLIAQRPSPEATKHISLEIRNGVANAKVPNVQVSLESDGASLIPANSWFYVTIPPNVRVSVGDQPAPRAALFSGTVRDGDPHPQVDGYIGARIEITGEKGSQIAVLSYSAAGDNGQLEVTAEYRVTDIWGPSYVNEDGNGKYSISLITGEGETLRLTVFGKYENGTPLKFNELYRSAHSNYGDAQQLALHNQDEVNRVWSELTGQEPPKLEEGQSVLAVTMGTQSTGGYGIEITAVNRVTNPDGSTEVVATIRTTSPDPNGMVTQALTNPIHAVVVSGIQGLPVSFVYEEDNNGILPPKVESADMITSKCPSVGDGPCMVFDLAAPRPGYTRKEAYQNEDRGDGWLYTGVRLFYDEPVRKMMEPEVLTADEPGPDSGVTNEDKSHLVLDAAGEIVGGFEVDETYRPDGTLALSVKESYDANGDLANRFAIAYQADGVTVDSTTTEDYASVIYDDAGQEVGGFAEVVEKRPDDTLASITKIEFASDGSSTSNSVKYDVDGKTVIG